MMIYVMAVCYLVTPSIGTECRILPSYLPNQPYYRSYAECMAVKRRIFEDRLQNGRCLGRHIDVWTEE